MRHMVPRSTTTIWVPICKGRAALTSCSLSPLGEIWIVHIPLIVIHRTSISRDHPPTNVRRTLNANCGISMISFLSMAIMTTYGLETTSFGRSFGSEGSATTSTAVVKGAEASSEGILQICMGLVVSRIPGEGIPCLPTGSLDTKRTKGIRQIVNLVRVLCIPAGADSSQIAGIPCCSRTSPNIWCTSTEFLWQCPSQTRPVQAFAEFCDSSHIRACRAWGPRLFDEEGVTRFHRFKGILDF
jgi:hypothetical protein